MATTTGLRDGELTEIEYQADSYDRRVQEQLNAVNTLNVWLEVKGWERCGEYVRVKLGAAGGGDGEITVTIPRQAWADARLEPGAQWTVTPGPRLDGYSEQLQAARRALLENGGDLDALTEGQREMILESYGPYGTAF